MENHTISNHQDIVLQSIFPKRLCIAIGKHAEFFVDAKIVLKMLNLIREARHSQEDCEDGRLSVYYSDDSENEHDEWCMVQFDDFSLQRLTTDELFKVEQGLASFFNWTAGYSMPISDPFLFKIK